MYNCTCGGKKLARCLEEGLKHCSNELKHWVEQYSTVEASTVLGRGIETLFKWIETLSRTVQKKLGNGIETVHGVHVEGRRWMNSILFCGEMTIFFCNQTGERHYIILYIIYSICLICIISLMILGMRLPLAHSGGRRRRRGRFLILFISLE